MALSDVMDSIQKTADSKAAKDLTEQDFIDNMDGLRNLIAFFRWYPDLFIDYIKKPDNPFNFYFNQRIILRAMMRYQKSFMTFPRAFSKSFLAMMCHMIRATLYPNSQLFLTTGGKIISFLL